MRWILESLERKIRMKEVSEGGSVGCDSDSLKFRSREQKIQFSLKERAQKSKKERKKYKFKSLAIRVQYAKKQACDYSIAVHAV